MVQWKQLRKMTLSTRSIYMQHLNQNLSQTYTTVINWSMKSKRLHFIVTARMATVQFPFFIVVVFNLSPRNATPSISVNY